jgi:hypothetical protein
MVTISHITVYLTYHFRERYNERVGKAPPSGQKVWLEKSIRKNRPRQVSGDEYQTKLIGAPFTVYLTRISGSIWVAKTIMPSTKEGRRTSDGLFNSSAKEKDICDSQGTGN